MVSVWCARVAEEGCSGLGDSETGDHLPLTSGPESSRTLPADSTVADLAGLQPGTTYQVAVLALRGRDEGPPAVIVARTGQGPTRSLGFLPPESQASSFRSPTVPSAPILILTGPS